MNQRMDCACDRRSNEMALPEQRERAKVRKFSRFLFKLAAAFTVLAITTAVAAAATRQVSTTGTDTGDCTASPCLTINYALGQAVSGDTIAVGAGTYAESVFVGKRVALLGSGATIDAAGLDNGVLINGASAAGTVLSGFTIQHATLEGILAVQTSDLTISDNTVINNDLGFFFPIPPPFCGGFDDCGEAVHLLSVAGSTLRNNLIQNNVGGILLTDEAGPNHGNTIRDNTVLDNEEDCGITLASHYFSLIGPAPAALGGIYDNHVLHNTSNGNGAAGIGIFAGPPGGAAYGNEVIGNTAMNNGLPGVAIHSHLFAQYVNDNVIVNNTLSGNGPDDDAQTGADTGISIFSDITGGAAPIAHTVVSANSISNEHFGIYIVHATKVSGLQSNKFSSVAVPIFTSP
jgi:parallel beta-helix repeat protein